MPPQNPSLGAAWIGPVRTLNRLFATRSGRLDRLRRRLITRLSRLPGDARLVLPVDTAAEFMQRWQGSNAQVARTYFDRPDGVLFRSTLD